MYYDSEEDSPMYYEEEKDPATINIRRSWTPYYREVYTVKCLDKIIYTTVSSDPDEVDNWIDRVHMHSPYGSRSSTIGLGIQWKPYTRSYFNMAPIATIQICVKKSCLIYQLLDEKYFIPESLRNLLESDITVAIARFNIDQPL